MRTPSDAADPLFKLHKRIPDTRITDTMREINEATRFTDAFTHLRSGVPTKDNIGLMNVPLAEGRNLGLSKMAEASNSHDFR
ncbi:Tn3 family transposase [Cognatishimia maritima]|uniref:Tn3 family transposase n=1 Tax=Cognatishimia maritima TaxID=870908 RepID=UPI000A9143D3|nr:Tn3 family transposase [Cognatishimia maritima]